METFSWIVYFILCIVGGVFFGIITAKNLPLSLKSFFILIGLLLAWWAFITLNIYLLYWSRGW